MDESRFFHCTGQMVDSVYGVVWVSGLLMSTLLIEWPMVAVGLWYGQAYIMDHKHKYSKTAHFRVAFYCGQPKAHLCNNHAV